MKTNTLIRMGGCMIAVCLLASLSVAQEAIDDSELMKMLENANAGATAKAEPQAEAQETENQVAQAQDVAEQAEERTAETEAAMENSAVEQTVEEAVEPSADETVAEKQTVEEPVEPSVEEAAAEEDATEETVAEETAMEEAVVEETATDEASIETAMVDDLGMISYDEGTATSSDELISVRLNKVGLEEAINLFAQLSGANIIVPELTEAAQISVNLKDVEWRPALQSILDAYDYELYQKVSGSNVFSVRRRPAGAPEPQVVETFVLKYATVPNAAALVRELVPEDAKISEFASRNMLVVKSTESSLSEIRTVLETIDTVREQVFIESKFMELNDKAQKDLGIDWQVLQNYSAGTVGPTSYQYGQQDSRVEENNSFSDLSGTPYNEGDGSFDNVGTLNGDDVLAGLTPTRAVAESDVTTKVLTSVLDADEFRVVLSALEENTGVNKVSNPTVIVANEEKATISIVRKEPNLKQERQQTAGAQGGAAIDNIVFTLDPEMPFFEYGIKLDVTPSINTSSNITVRINPALTRFVSDKQAGDNTYPVYDEKSIETVFNLSSGQTAAIGGLTEVTDSDIERKVPLLGSIPFLGRLFSWEQTVSEQQETIIFVTVGLANTQTIALETGLPEDAELSRRRLIRDESKRVLRDQGRIYYQSEEQDKVKDMIEAMDEREQQRKEKRAEIEQKKQEKEAADNEVAMN